MTDPITISTILGIASQTTGLAKTSVTLAKSVRDLVGKSEDADPDLKAKVGELVDKLGEAAIANGMLKAQIAEMHEAMRKESRFANESEGFAIHETQEGYIVYKRDAAPEGEPTLFACTKCFYEERLSILQGDEYRKKCFACESKFFFNTPPKGPYRSNTRMF